MVFLSFVVVHVIGDFVALLGAYFYSVFCVYTEIGVVKIWQGVGQNVFTTLAINATSLISSRSIKLKFLKPWCFAPLPFLGLHF